ncbi:MAG: leucyl aminopeptidase [Planctomycetota bacterium]|jgi:leucyl aminopeptidase
MQFKAAGTVPSKDIDALVLFKGEGTNRISSPDAALSSAANAAIKAGEFSGKGGETLLLHGGAGGRRLLLTGTGAGDDPDALRRAAGVAARTLEARGMRRAVMLVPARANARDIVEGAGLAAYRFVQLKSKKSKPKLRNITVVPEGKAGSPAKAVKQGAALVDAVAFARDLGNLPGNVAHPVYLAKQARSLADKSLTVKIHNRADIKRMKMGAFAAVAQASDNEPRLIEMRYRGAPSSKKTVALVGKGVTFDTGGISLKPGAQMEEMKFDMCGGAAVLGVMHAIHTLKPKLNVHALVPATDNMPGGKAYRPGDVITARNGKTIEIYSTDAEGRLLLCDALAYAAEKKPTCIVDLATLTGACVVALADAACGLFGNDDDLVGRVRAAGDRAGEVAWPMPLLPRYTEMIQGIYADLKNNHPSRWGGACTAAAFLKEFVGDVPWVHLDVAGTAWSDRDAGYHRKGATGFGVRLLWEFLNG